MRAANQLRVFGYRLGGLQLFHLQLLRELEIPLLGRGELTVEDAMIVARVCAASSEAEVLRWLFAPESWAGRVGWWWRSVRYGHRIYQDRARLLQWLKRECATGGPSG